MSQKALDVFFRHKFLISLPLVILVLAGLVASWSRQSTVYSASAQVWTQTTPLLASRLDGNANSFLTPAQSQALVLNELLILDSFRLSVAAKVDGLAGLDPRSQVRAVREGTTVFASGVNVLTVRHRDSDPALAQAIVRAVIDTYSERIASDVATQADAAQAFYEERLEGARTELEERKAALARYQVTLPTSSDLQLTELRAEVERAQENRDSLLDRLEQIHLERDAALTGRDISFQVTDPPELPSSPLPTAKRDLLIFPILGLLLGISGSAAVLVALTRLDDSIRLPMEARRLGVPVLAVVPELGRRRQRFWPQHFVRLVVAASRGLMGNLR